MKKFRNTAQKGSVRYIVFKPKNEADWYAVGLEFNIVENASDPRVALVRLFEAIQGYVESFKKIGGARPYTLNQAPDAEYEKLWMSLNKGKAIPSPFVVDSFGEKSLARS